MNKLHHIIITFIAACIIMTSCNEGDDFSTDSNLDLSFSSNKINLDTVFSTIGSPFKRFKIYNKNSNSILIESIELVNAPTSGFSINIDGLNGNKLENIKILKQDSLIGLVRVSYKNEDNQKTANLQDIIRFKFNGKIQELPLEALSMDVYVYDNKTIETNTTLPNDKPHLIYNALTINEGATLTIKAGTQFYLNSKASLQVNGTLNIEGLIESPVIFRGSRFDYIENNIPYNNVPGQWEGIVFNSSSYNNRLQNVKIRNAVRGMTFTESDPSVNKATLINTIVHNTSDYGIFAVNCNIDAINCLFSNSKNTVLTLIGGRYSFLHCTLANYFRWSPRQPNTVKIMNSLNEQKFNIERCDFINSIVYGSSNKELMIANSSGANINYRFINCLLRNTEQQGTNFNNVIWNKDPHFIDLNSERIYNYNFELSSESAAINKADKAYSKHVPYDLNGKPRLRDSNPDIGCYEAPLR